MVIPGSGAMYEIISGSLKDNSLSPGLLASIEYDGQLSATAYVILAVVLLGIIAGLGWCFYRAVTAAGRTAESQSPDEVGDENSAEKQ